MKQSEERTRQAKRKIFEQIEILLDSYDVEDISFGKIAKRLGCRPNSVFYYFENKMDMLLQFLQDYIVTADTELLPVLRAGIDALPPAERFCKEIDCLFAVSEHKSRSRLLINHFLASSAPLYSAFCEDLDHKMEQDTKNIRNLLEGYQCEDILCEERFYDAYVELEFYVTGFSLIHIFKLPIFRYEDMVHNIKEYLKYRFLKDGLYAPDYHPVIIPDSFFCTDIERSSMRFQRNGADTPSLKLEVLRTINQLLSENNPEDITFAKLADLCYSQPSGIAYYFNGKDDMLLQALILKTEVLTETIQYSIPSAFEGVKSLRVFCDVIHKLCNTELEANTYLFWFYYFIMKGIATKPAYRDYFCYLQQRRYRQLAELVSHFRQEPYINHAALLPTLTELFFFYDEYILYTISRTPILDAEHLKKLVEKRFIQQLIKPEYHSEALAKE